MNAKNHGFLFTLISLITWSITCMLELENMGCLIISFQTALLFYLLILYLTF